MDEYLYDSNNNRYTIMRSRPGFVMCDRCLAILAASQIEDHECIEWWQQPSIAEDQE